MFSIVSNQVLLVGGSGYLGANLNKKLTDEGYVVTVTGTRKSSVESGYIEVDFERPSTFKNIGLSKYDLIVVLASKIRSLGTQNIGHADFKINVLGFGRFLDFIKEKAITEKLIYVSSMTVYSPDNISPVGEHATLAPISTYGLSKKVAEDLTRFFSAHSPTKSLILRLPGIYGGNRLGGFIYNTIQRINNNERIKINTSGLGYWEAIHIDDLTSMMIQLLSNYAWQEKVETFNLCYGEETDICQTGKFIGEYLGASDSIDIIEDTGYVQLYMNNQKIKMLTEIKHDYYSRLKTYIDSLV